MTQATPDDLLKKATGGAETPRQMMLNLNVIRDGSKGRERDVKLAQYETILKNRWKGGKKAAELADQGDPKAAMRAAVEAVETEEELLRRREALAIRDANHILSLLDVFLEDKLHLALPGTDRESLILSLQNVITTIKTRS